MPQTPHVERHFTASDRVRDVVIGMSDGLTVPFALAAGLSGAVSSNAIVITAGLAEVAAGSIAMGLGGYLAARGDADHYRSELERERREVDTVPEMEAEEVGVVFRDYGLADAEIAPVLRAFRERPSAWVDFMMRFELGLERPQPTRARNSALTIAGAYIAGGLVPLAPYFFTHTSNVALPLSIVVTLLALATFGWVEGKFTGVPPVRGALQTVLVGGIAAAAAFGLAKALGGAA